MKLPSIPLVVLDTETTGFVPGVHRIMEYACTVIEGGEIKKEYEQLLSVQGEDQIPPAIQVLTHITTKDLEGQPTFGDVFAEIESMIPQGALIVGQNVRFDLSMLKGEGWDLSEMAWIDTAMLASLVFPELSSYSLGYMSTALNLNHTPKHRALGDVRATVELLSKCYERLSELPAKDLEMIKSFAARGPEGYKKFFDSIPNGKGTKKPLWLKEKKASVTRHKGASVSAPLPIPAVGTVQLVSEPLGVPYVLQLCADAPAGTWIAVKNLDATLRRLPDDSQIAVLPPPEFVLSDKAAAQFLEQKVFSADELTLAIKLYLYEPLLKADLPIHGDEHAVWAGKLALHREDPAYQRALSKATKSAVLLSHHDLLKFAMESPSPVAKAAHIIIDDASMLEDTATQSLGWTCIMPTLRAAAEGSDVLTKCADLIELWVEKTRTGTDVRYLVRADLETAEAEQLKKIIKTALKEELTPAPTKALEHLLLILDPENLTGRIAWMESFMDGSKAIKSVPENIAELLASLMYSSAPVSLILPLGSEDSIAAILPSAQPVTSFVPQAPKADLHLKLLAPKPMDLLLESPTGRMIILVGSKRTIEDLYTKHALRCEAQGITLLCQGFSGGQSRMQAEFALAKSPVVMVMTPWMFETVELKTDSVDHLIMQTLPFDHPSHPVLSRRAARYQDPFNEYSLARLLLRLFRLIRTFSRCASAGAIIEVLDDRLSTKQYGKKVTEYLKAALPESSSKKNSQPEGQMALL
jgi:DNA polymerase III epsilon subunit-like protein